MRTMEMIELGPELRREARGQCESVNAAYFAVHEVLMSALADEPVVAPGGTLHGELSSRVRHRLIERSISRCGTVSCSWAMLGRLRQ